ncbi:MAG: GNAT family N-acetyltransferase [Ignavibacteriae bacterium]|nr:MAG: GNAT family N-acetyltransferase [Ignavibacteriota bacterium]
MEIIENSDKWKEKWDKFVLESNNGTVFHTQKFFDYHTEGKFDFNHLLFVEKSNIVALLPGARISDLYESPIGASYGSIVTKDVKFAQAMEIVSALLEYGKEKRIKEFLLTSAPRIYENHPNENLDFAMLWQGFSYDLHYISSAIRLNGEEDILSRFQQTVRRNIRKTMKDPDIRVEINERYDQFFPILLENKAKHDIKPTHSYDDLMKLKELMPDQLKLFMVYYKDKPIAGSSLFLCNKTVSLCFYNMLLYEFEHLKPIHRIMYEVVKWSTENEFKYVDIGVSQDTKADNPMTPSMTLIDFKEKFDAKTVMRNTLLYKFI